MTKKTANGQPVPQLSTPTPPEVPVWPGLVAAAVVGFVYLAAASQGTFHFRQSLFPHHVLIADAWLHGQLHVRDAVLQERSEEFFRDYRATVEQRLQAQGKRLTEAGWQSLRARVKPPMLHDWSVVDGKYYGYWGPTVPALLVPYVALAGVQASDMLFSCLVGTATVLLTFLMLRQANHSGFIPMTTSACTALALLLGLGTVHFFLAVAGQVWFLSQIVANLFLMLAVWFMLRSTQGLRWAIAAGAAFGASYLSRNSVLPTVPFFYFAAVAIAQRSAGDAWRQAIRSALGFSVPLIVAGGIGLAYNYQCFGNPFESGVRLQLVTNAHPMFTNDYLRYGMFNLHYMPGNLYYYFINPMLRYHPTTHAVTFDPFGNSMFLVTPPLVYVFRSFRRRDLLTVGIWIGAATSMVLLLLFMGTGWYGFGNRYLLDLIPLAILLIAIGMNGRLSRPALVLIGLSIIINAWGTYRFIAEQF
jgi:hypothetical protein